MTYTNSHHHHQKKMNPGTESNGLELLLLLLLLKKLKNIISQRIFFSFYFSFDFVCLVHLFWMKILSFFSAELRKLSLSLSLAHSIIQNISAKKNKANDIIIIMVFRTCVCERASECISHNFCFLFFIYSFVVFPFFFLVWLLFWNIVKFDSKWQFSFSLFFFFLVSNGSEHCCC